MLELANRYNVPVLPRGGGTSLIGQTVNHAVVLDFSKYMNQVLEVNREELWCRVQPGVIQDELNAHVRPMGLLFGPDTSTSNRATIGGMSGNNSAGSHSIAYGKTIDHVLELRCLLADGSEIVLRDLTPAELEAKCRADGLEGQIYREVRRLVAQHADEIRARYPKLMRRVSGYNLDEFVKPQPFGLHRLAVGSEGTLVAVVEMKMRLVRRPKFTALDVIHYDDLQAALESSVDLLTTGPYAVEVTDKMILDLARGEHRAARADGVRPGRPAGHHDRRVLRRDRGRGARQGRGAGGAARAEADRLRRPHRLRSRRAAVHLEAPQGRPRVSSSAPRATGSPSRSSRTRRSIPAKLGPFIARFREILGRHGAAAGYYGHCSVGCLHIRPLINLKDAGEIRKMQRHRRGDHGPRDGVRRRRSPASTATAGRGARSTRRCTARGSTTPSGRSSAPSTRRGSSTPATSSTPRR